MHRQKLFMGLVAGAAIAAAAALAPGKQAEAADGWNCFASKMGGDCGCPTKCWDNCTCPSTIAPPASTD